MAATWLRNFWQVYKRRSNASVDSCGRHLVVVCICRSTHLLWIQVIRVGSPSFSNDNRWIVMFQFSEFWSMIVTYLVRLWTVYAETTFIFLLQCILRSCTQWIFLCRLYAGSTALGPSCSAPSQTTDCEHSGFSFIFLSKNILRLKFVANQWTKYLECWRLTGTKTPAKLAASHDQDRSGGAPTVLGV